jgi:hypothetical protein
VNIVAFLVAESQPALDEEPEKYAFDYTAMFAQSTAVFGAAFGDKRFNAAVAQGLADFVFGVVGPIGKQFFGTATTAASGTLNGRDRVNQRDGSLRVVDVRAGVLDRQRNALAIADDVPLRAVFAAIRGIRTCLRPPKTARTEQLSTTALDQSISLASPSSSRNIRHTLSQTPAKCQSRSRRQQVMPQPQPISSGKYSQAQPLRSTNRMPVSAWRSGTRGRPPLGLGGSGGSKGWIRSHNSSVSSGLAISGSSMNRGNLRQLLTSLQ